MASPPGRSPNTPPVSRNLRDRFRQYLRDARQYRRDVWERMAHLRDLWKAAGPPDQDPGPTAGGPAPGGAAPAPPSYGPAPGSGGRRGVLGLTWSAVRRAWRLSRGALRGVVRVGRVVRSLASEEAFERAGAKLEMRERNGVAATPTPGPGPSNSVTAVSRPFAFQPGGASTNRAGGPATVNGVANPLMDRPVKPAVAPRIDNGSNPDSRVAAAKILAQHSPGHSTSSAPSRERSYSPPPSAVSRRGR
jgi:hypothetical protein